MAQFKIRIPLTARVLISEVYKLLDMDFGIPMEIEIPESVQGAAWEWRREGRAKLVIANRGKLVMDIVVTNAVTQDMRVQIARLEGNLKMERWFADAWMDHLQGIAGPISHTQANDGGDNCITFVIESDAIERLRMKAAEKPHSLPGVRLQA